MANPELITGGGGVRFRNDLGKYSGALFRNIPVYSGIFRNIPVIFPVYSGGFIDTYPSILALNLVV